MTETVRVCIDCGIPTIRTGSRGPWPKRCGECLRKVKVKRSNAITKRRLAEDPEYRKRHRELGRLRVAKARAADPEATRKWDREWKKKRWAEDPVWRAKQIDSRRRFRYGLRKGQYAEMLESQGGGCAICGRTPNGTNLGIDHDHTCCDTRTKSCGKCIRGLLCDTCNRALGLLKDDPVLLRAAAAYLER